MVQGGLEAVGGGTSQWLQEAPILQRGLQRPLSGSSHTDTQVTHRDTDLSQVHRTQL